MNLKQVANNMIDEIPAETLDSLAAYLKSELDTLSSGKDWKVTGVVSGWDFQFVCELGDFKRHTASHDFTKDPKELISRLKTDSQMIYSMWSRERYGR